mmetsp:Transcript_51628/g.147215  ORF Transcript_51628/g.147215 Transcript_51628/m.147215 type:complete len:200 (-) Transcript_51628:90-689(-)
MGRSSSLVSSGYATASVHRLPDGRAGYLRLLSRWRWRANSHCVTSSGRPGLSLHSAAHTWHTLWPSSSTTPSSFSRSAPGSSIRSRHTLLACQCGTDTRGTGYGRGSWTSSAADSLRIPRDRATKPHMQHDFPMAGNYSRFPNTEFSAFVTDQWQLACCACTCVLVRCRYSFWHANYAYTEGSMVGHLLISISTEDYAC